MNKSTHEGPVQISEGIVLAVLSGFAYAEAYAYERGFAGALGIPRELIDLRWTTIFAAWAALALAAATMLAIHYLPKRNFALKTLSTVVITGVILVPTLGFSRWRLQLGLMLLVGALFVFFEIFTALLNAGLRKINRVASGQSKFEGEATVEFENKDMLVWGFRVPLWATVGVLWMVLALEFGLILGVVQADDTEEFLVTSAVRPQAVIRIYGDKMVTAELDRETQTLHPIYRVLPITDSARIFVSEHLPNMVPICAVDRKSQDELGDPKSFRSKVRRRVWPESEERIERCYRYWQRRDSTTNKKPLIQTKPTTP